jgi:glycosyltransferase involved in cell wall biosynthesis
LKILLVNHLLDAVTGGGTAERTYQLARFLATAGAEVTVLTLDIGITPARKAGLGRVRLVALPCLNTRFFVPRASMSALREIVAGADVVHLSGHWTLLNALVYRACRRFGKPYLFCPAGALQPFGRSLAVKRVYDRLVGRKLAQMATACVAITEAEREDFQACGVKGERVTVIPNGIDPDDFDVDDLSQRMQMFRDRVGVGAEPFILFLGRLNEIKGPDLLLDAFISLGQAYSRMHLVFAGPDGGLREQLGVRANTAGIGARVHFPGFVAGEEKVAALSASALLVIPSRREAMSIVVLEGGICGCPVLFTDACGLEDFARSGVARMVGVTSPEIAAGIAEMLDAPAAAAAAADGLRAIILEQYLWAARAQQLLRLADTCVTASRER